VNDSSAAENPIALNPFDIIGQVAATVEKQTTPGMLIRI
jgi:hypothetical protein